MDIMGVRYDPRRDDEPLYLGGFCGKNTVAFGDISACLRSLLSTMMSNLGDLLSHGHVGIEELPNHSNAYPLRIISVRYRASGLS